ncbi:hypothetical protein CVT24_005741, partial [Panaeolus cyanescens]
HLSSICAFKPLEIQPQHKDGGVFVRFSYAPPELDGDADPLTALETRLQEAVDQQGSFPTWHGFGGGNIWIVRGKPWREDMDRFASPILKVFFDGPDVQQQTLYELCRPYGRIKDITLPTPVPPGSMRSSTITFHRVNSAAIARNVIYGRTIPSTAAITRLRVDYEKPIQAHVVRDWMSSHPKFMIPVLVFLLGTFTYTIFDPIRAWMVEAKATHLFDYRKSKVYQWLHLNSIARLSHKSDEAEVEVATAAEVWKDRKDAEESIQAYLADMPSTVTFIHGPQGSGKTTMLKKILADSNRSYLIIDCRPLQSAPTDPILVSGLAAQTGYWPIFTSLNSMNNLIDMASVGLIGQKAGLSSSVQDQMKQVLSIVTEGLQGVTKSRRSATSRKIRKRELEDQERQQDLERRAKISRGIWHDGRLDCVAGNGVMSELGMGDEKFDLNDTDKPSEDVPSLLEETKETIVSAQKTHNQEESDALASLPIVVIRNYAITSPSSSKSDLLTVLADWAANLVENKIAHVIVLSDNRENAKRVANGIPGLPVHAMSGSDSIYAALPSKPLNTIALSDADAKSSLYFVRQKLQDAELSSDITDSQLPYLQRLGGRASDLESLIHKVRHGMSVKEAVEDIIVRSVPELRKRAFGDDVDDAKKLAWAREQAWEVIRRLSKSEEIPYYDLLLEFPFKGDEAALRNMEHAEILSIGMKEGRPSTIRPGKPVFRWVFERMVDDRTFQATQDLAFNEKYIKELEEKIKTYEQELSILRSTMKNEDRSWWDFRKSPLHDRAQHVGSKLATTQRKVHTLDRKNSELKRFLAKRDNESHVAAVQAYVGLSATTMQHIEQELQHTLKLSKDAFSSGAWIYPIYGAVYLVTNPALLRSLYPVLLRAIATSVAVTFGLFAFTYIPQIALFSVVLGPFAIIPATLLVLVEAYFLTTFITKTFLFRSAQDQIFDSVIQKQGYVYLLERGRTSKRQVDKSAFQDLTEPIAASFGRFSKEGILRYIVTAPLNLIPVVGTVIFLLYNGKKSGPSFHERYFFLKGMDESAAKQLIKQKRGAYTAFVVLLFGAAALALNLVPVVGSIFNVASVVGAALWACKFERENKQQSRSNDVSARTKDQ